MIAGKRLRGKTISHKHQLEQGYNTNHPNINDTIYQMESQIAHPSSPVGEARIPPPGLREGGSGLCPGAVDRALGDDFKGLRREKMPPNDCSRSSSREVRISWYPMFFSVVHFSRVYPPPKKA